MHIDSPLHQRRIDSERIRQTYEATLAQQQQQRQQQQHSYLAYQKTNAISFVVVKINRTKMRIVCSSCLTVVLATERHPSSISCCNRWLGKLLTGINFWKNSRNIEKFKKSNNKVKTFKLFICVEKNWSEEEIVVFNQISREFWNSYCNKFTHRQSYQRYFKFVLWKKYETKRKSFSHTKTCTHLYFFSHLWKTPFPDRQKTRQIKMNFKATLMTPLMVSW